MRNFTFLLLLAAFFLASFCGATSPDTTQDSRLFSSANAIERGTKRVLRVPSTATDKSEERGIFSGLFKVKTTYIDAKTLSGIDELMATLKGLKGKSGDDVDKAISAISSKTNVGVAKVENAYKNYKALGASRTKKELISIMELEARTKFIDDFTNTLAARFEGKSWDDVLKTLDSSMTKADVKVIKNQYDSYHALGLSLMRLWLHVSKINILELDKKMQSVSQNLKPAV